MKTDKSEFRMPALGADMESGTVSEWLVKPGDRIRKGDIIAVIDTDKALIEVESFHTGVVDSLLVSTGHRVPVGTPLAVITSPYAEEPEAKKPPKATGEQETEPPEAPIWPTPHPHPSLVTSPLVRHLAERRGIDAAKVPGTGPGGRVTRADVEHAGTEVTASPLARRIARELGVDLDKVRGTGRHGAVRAEDVREAAAEAGPRVGTARTTTAPETPAGTARWQAGARAEREPGLGAGEREGGEEGEEEGEEARKEDRRRAMRQAIARAMARSKREIPHYYLGTTIDMSAPLAWLRERNRDLPVTRRLLPAALLLKAAALAAAEVPALNGFWIDDAFTPGSAVHLGVAIGLKGGGLIAPAIHDAAGRDLDDLMAALRDLVARARAGRLRDTEMTEATITVTNLGDQGADLVHGVIYPPQVALVGFGRILQRPWAVDGLLGVHPLVTATLAADHRATDGYTGGRFLAAVNRLLNHPEEL